MPDPDPVAAPLTPLAEQAFAAAAGHLNYSDQVGITAVLLSVLPTFDSLSTALAAANAENDELANQLQVAWTELGAAVARAEAAEAVCDLADQCTTQMHVQGAEPPWFELGRAIEAWLDAKHPATAAAWRMSRAEQSKTEGGDAL